MEIIFNNYSGARIDRSILRKLAGRISLPAGRQARKKMIVSISFVPESEIKRLNRMYRHMNRPTDVLSFNMNEGKYLGDVVICPSIAKINSARYGSTFKSEISRLVAHGLLHLLGYDHGKKMFDMQDKILALR